MFHRLSASCTDIRYTKDITQLSNVLKDLQKINGIYYNWKTEEFPDNKFSKERQIGVIAQELEQVYPELVITDRNGYKTVDYPKLSAILIEAIKETNEQWEESFKLQDSIIRGLMIDNTALQSRLATVEARLGLAGND